MASTRNRLSDPSAACVMVLGGWIGRAGGRRRRRRTELGGDHHVFAERRQRLADDLLIGERAVDLGGVEERDAALDGGPDESDRIVAVGERG
jgi:hypothetical protein